jgi:hypothetical protein
MRKAQIVVLVTLIVCMLAAVKTATSYPAPVNPTAYAQEPSRIEGVALGAPSPQSGAVYEEPTCKGQIGKACGPPASCRIVEWTYIASNGQTIKSCYCADTSKPSTERGKNARPYQECSHGTH